MDAPTPDTLEYAVDRRRGRFGRTFYVIAGVLALELALLALSFYRPARTAIAFGGWNDPRVIKRVGITQGRLIVVDIDYKNLPAGNWGGASVNAVGVSYRHIPGAVVHVTVHSAWIIVPTVVVLIWQMRRRLTRRAGGQPTE